MYTRQEASLVRKKFWTSFGQYMQPVKGTNGDKINWLNYKTGIRYIYFRMDAGKDSAYIAIELRHPDPAAQQFYFEQLRQLEKILEAQTGEEWEWLLQVNDEDGNTMSRIKKEIIGVNVFNEADWPAIISFLKPRIIALDEFWQQVKDGFDIL
ncbi:MAG: DUF4268 domain-containing protein [Chitinophagaceae bacterium]